MLFKDKLKKLRKAATLTQEQADAIPKKEVNPFNHRTATYHGKAGSPMKQSDAAYLTGMNLDAYKAVENGPGMPRMATILKMAKLFNVTVDDLVDPEKVV